jgi:hypothetical protein
MGPVSLDWIKQHGDCWAAGRIDIYGPWYHPDEYGLPPMHKEDWIKFSDWLDNLKTKHKWSFKRIISEYEKTNPKIRWLRKDSVSTVGRAA